MLALVVFVPTSCNELAAGPMKLTRWACCSIEVRRAASALLDREAGAGQF